MTCAFAVRGALKKLPGVEAVDVSLNKGLAAVRLKSGNTLQPVDLWQTVRKNGFTPRGTTVLVRGEVAGARFRVSGTNQLFDLAPDPGNPKAADDLRANTGKTLTVQAVLTPKSDVTLAVPLQVRGIDKGR